MPQTAKLTVHDPSLDADLTFSVQVPKVVMNELHIRLEGLPETEYPDLLQEHLTFYEKNNAVLVGPDDAVTVECVSPITEE